MLVTLSPPPVQLETTPDVERVAALPARPPVTPELLAALSAWARKPGSAAELRETQAAALVELATLRGLLADMEVGSGKTLVTMLAPRLLGAQRPVLMVPASLREKTRRDFANYFRDWHVVLPKLLSYETLGHPQHEHDLFDLAPDLLMLDEADGARNLDAAVTRRIKRYREAHPECVVVPLSGTLITDDLLDYHHFARWSLGDAAPVPEHRAEAERWSQAVNKDVPLLSRIGTGALGDFATHFRTRRGIVQATGSSGCDASIRCSWWSPVLPDKLRVMVDTVARSGLRPDGEPLDDWELPDCLCQLALGFFYVWDPMPPSWWLRPRRAWLAYVRAVLDEHLPGFDSPSQVALALDRMGGHVPPAPAEGRELLAAWREVQDKFVPNPVPVWIDVSPLVQAAQTAERGTLIWTRFRAAGWMLERIGVPYYGADTLPETAKPGSTIALSIRAHYRGINMQAWHRNRVLVPPADAKIWHQLIGRTHREGQNAPTVYVEIINAIPYHGDVVKRALAQARATSKARGSDQKLTLADWV